MKEFIVKVRMNDNTVKRYDICAVDMHEALCTAREYGSVMSVMEKETVIEKQLLKG